MVVIYYKHLNASLRRDVIACIMLCKIQVNCILFLYESII